MGPGDILFQSRQIHAICKSFSCPNKVWYFFANNAIMANIAVRSRRRSSRVKGLCQNLSVSGIPKKCSVALYFTSDKRLCLSHDTLDCITL